MKSKDYWNQLQNVVSLSVKQDQIAWMIFSLFSAGNAVLLVGLFASGKVPDNLVGGIISAAGLTLSFVWTIIQRRAVNLLSFYEELIGRLESQLLKLDPKVATHARVNTKLFEEMMNKQNIFDKLVNLFLCTFGEKGRVRNMMCAFICFITLAWGFSCWIFFSAL